MVRGTTTAKTARPSASNVLPRERLFAALDSARRASLLWVHGPPGCGKTSLVSSYLDARASNGIWYQVDAGDTDPATLCLYLGESVGGNGDAGPRRLPLFTAEYQAEPRAFARHYFRSLFDALEPPFLLVFDNYQELGPDSAVHDMVREALAEMPAEGCVVVLSRTPPPAAFIRLRANREMKVMDWDALRLSREESDTIVRAHLEGVSDAALGAIYERTDGWAAALILALEQGRGGAGLPTADAAPQLLFDYLAGEVFASFEPEVRTLLLRTAFVEEMSVDMAVALSGDDRAGALLDMVHSRHQMLTVKAGASGPVYACHPLLREYLLAHAARVLSEEQRSGVVLHAARILEGEGAADTALRLLSSHGHHEALAAAVLRNAASMLAAGRTRTLERWLEQMPRELCQQDPWLCYWLGACRFQRDPGLAREVLEDAYALFVAQRAEDLNGRARAAALAMHAVIFALDDFSSLDRWIERAEGLAGMPELDVESKGQLAVSLFMALVFRQPHHPRIGEWAERALAASRTLGDARLRLSTQLLLAINLNYTGQFEHALGFLQGMRGHADAPGAQPLERTTLKAVESMYHMLNAEAEPCLKAVFDGLEIAEQTGVQLWGHHLLSNGLAGALGVGDLGTATELIGRMRHYAHGARRLDRSCHHYYRSWHAMLCGDLDAALREPRSALSLAEETGCPFYVVLCRLAMAQVLLARGDIERADREMRQVRPAARAINNRLLEYMTMLTYADVALAGGRRRVALVALRRGFRVGREHGFRHSLWWLPESISRVAAVALQEGIESEHVLWLIRTRGLRPPARGPARGPWPWPIELQTLGGFRVGVNRAAEPGRISGKPLGLLRCLVGLGGRVDETTIAALLWPRIDTDYARRSLTTTLHRLRKLLGEDAAVVLRHGRLSLDRDVCRLDLDALDEVLAEIDEIGGQLPEAGRAQALAALGARLLDLYAGPFMEGDEEMAFAPLRERIRNRVLSGLDTLTRACEEAGAAAQALSFYRRAIDQDPLAEAIHRRLMLTLRDLGQAAEAVEAYARCKTLLEVSRGRQPSPETRAIYEAVCRDL